MNAIGVQSEGGNASCLHLRAVPDTVLMESDGRTLCTCMLLWTPNGNSHNNITMVVKKPSQVLKQIRFLALLKKLETLTPFGGVS